MAELVQPRPVAFGARVELHHPMLKTVRQDLAFRTDFARLRIEANERLGACAARTAAQATQRRQHVRSPPGVKIHRRVCKSRQVYRTFLDRLLVRRLIDKRAAPPRTDTGQTFQHRRETAQPLSESHVNQPPSPPIRQRVLKQAKRLQSALAIIDGHASLDGQTKRRGGQAPADEFGRKLKGRVPPPVRQRTDAQRCFGRKSQADVQTHGHSFRWRTRRISRGRSTDVKRDFGNAASRSRSLR